MYPTSRDYAKLHPINNVKKMYNFDEPTDPIPNDDGTRAIWYIQYYGYSSGKDEEELYTPYGLGTKPKSLCDLFTFDRKVHETAQHLGLEEPLKPNDILETHTSFNPEHYGICDYSDADHPSTFAVVYGDNPFYGTEVKSWFHLTKFEKYGIDGVSYIPKQDYTYKFNIGIDTRGFPYKHALWLEKKEKRPFFHKYGHADIVMKNEKGATGKGTLQMDGYSIGWKEDYHYYDGKHLEITFRGNYASPNQGVPPAFVITARSNFDTVLHIDCDSTDPDFEAVPKAILQLKAGQREDAIFCANKVVTTPKVPIEVEPMPEVKDVSVDHKYDHLLSVPSTFYMAAPVLHSGDSSYEVIVQRNGTLEVVTRLFSSSRKHPINKHRQMWVGLAAMNSHKKLGEDYWYLIGGEDTTPEYRTFEKMMITAYTIDEYKDQYYDGVVKGYIKDLDLHFTTSATILTDHSEGNAVIADSFDWFVYSFPRIKVEFTSPKGFKGYLDIISDIKFNFFNDGPIKVDLPPNKTFTFIGY